MPSSKQNKVHIIIQAMRLYYYLTAKGVLNWQRTHPHARTHVRTQHAHTHTHTINASICIVFQLSSRQFLTHEIVHLFVPT